MWSTFQDQNCPSLDIRPNSPHPPPTPGAANRPALPPLCVLCLIRTEEMCGHETFERVAVKGRPRPPTSYSSRSRAGGFLIGWLSPNDTLNFPRLTEMKRLKSFAANVASVITGGQVSGVAAVFQPLQAQLGDVCQGWRGLDGGVGLVLMFQRVLTRQAQRWWKLNNTGSMSAR